MNAAVLIASKARDAADAAVILGALGLTDTVPAAAAQLKNRKARRGRTTQ